MYPWKTWSRTVIGPASARKPRAEPNWLKLLLDPGWLGDLLHLDPGGLGKLLGPGGIGRILLNPGGVVGHDGLVRGAAWTSCLLVGDCIYCLPTGPHWHWQVWILLG